MVTEVDALAPVIQLGELTVTFGLEEVLVEGPGERTRDTRLDATVEALREWARFDAHGRYRPLSGARTLRPDWHARFADIETATAALEAVYPLAQEHIAAWEEGRLRLISLDEVLDRQSGRYEPAASLPAAGRRLASALLCGQCVRVPAWRGDIPAPEAIPCPEPCSVLVSFCREAALWEGAPPPAARPDTSVALAAFDEPGNELREAYLHLRKNAPNE